MRRIITKRFTKMVLQKFIGLLPAKLAFPLNATATAMIRGPIAARIDTIERANKCLDNLSKICQHTSWIPLHASVLEIGTGWHGIDLVILKALGADRIHTIDHWRHLTWDALHASASLIRRGTESLQLSGLARTAQVAERLDTLLSAFSSESCLEAVLYRWNIRYEILPSCDISQTSKTVAPTDLFYSESVLQRIPIRQLARIIQYVSGKMLKQGGAVFARTDQKDIHTQAHVDSEAWGLEYLKYSDCVYHLMSSRKLNWQNRLRESDFVQLFLDSGIDVIHVESYVQEGDMERLKRTRLAKRFRAHDLRDLATRASVLIGNKRGARDQAVIECN